MRACLPQGSIMPNMLEQIALFKYNYLTIIS